MKMGKNNKGFTLIELLLVIAIIAILAAIIFISLGGQRERARVTTFKENMRGLVTTYTACTDGSGTIYTGNADGNSEACAGGTSGVSGKVPSITDCDGSGTVSLSSTQTSGDHWNFSSVCTRTAGDPKSCTANCNSDGCVFEGTCD